VVFAPVAWVSRRGAPLVWSLGQLALLLWLLSDVVRARPREERWLVAATVLAAPPLLLTFALNAFSLLILVAIWRAHRSLKEGRDRAAGAWLALGLFKPQLVVGPALATLVGRRWRAVAALVALAAAAVIVSVLACGPRIWLDFARATQVVHASFERFGIAPMAMYNLKGALLLAFGTAVRAAAPAIAIAGWLLGLLATAWIWRGPWRPQRPRFDLQMAATLVVGMFFSLHLYPQDGLLLVGAALLFESYLRRAGRPRTWFAALALASPIIWFVIELDVEPRVVRYPVLLAITLGVWMARELRRPENDETSLASAREAPSNFLS
jgi:hypothetical protein